jgi:trk system potassium uptake protein TrkH
MSQRFNHQLFLNIMGVLLLFFSVVFIAPAVVGFIYLEASSWVFVFCSVSCFMIGMLLRQANVIHKPFLSRQDGRLIIGLTWLLLPIVGSVPYTFLGSQFNVLDALFESFSGFTTTGSTLITDFTLIPKSMLFWRALTQWIGCLGFIFFLITLMPSIRNDAHNFFDTEFNSINSSRVKPHLRTTIYMIFIIYLLISGVCLVSLLVAKMDIFNAICYTFATVSTGGFMFNDGGISVFSPYIRLVLMGIMFVSGISYYLLYFLIASKRGNIFHDEQVKVYSKLILFASLILSLFFYFQTGFSTNMQTIFSTISKGFFYVISAVSTTGYSFSNLSNQSLPLFACAFLLFLMFPGGCSASSSTGLKIMRITILSRYTITAIKRLLFPHSVLPVRFNHAAIKDDSINMIFVFVFLYIIICVLGASLMTICGVSFGDAIMIASANINNVGSLGEEISTNHFTYAAASSWVKTIIIALMIIGRLEIYSFFVLFSRSIWLRR